MTIDIKKVISDIAGKNFTAYDEKDAMNDQFESIFDSKTVNMEHLRKVIIQKYADNKDADFLRFAENVAVWMTNLDDKHAKIQGTKLLNFLGVKTKSPSAIYNSVVTMLKKGENFVLANSQLHELLDSGSTDDVKLKSMILCTLADSYRMGRGTAKNVKRALDMYVEAAELGFADGAYNAGLYFEGKLSSLTDQIDTDRAAKYYKIASDRGHLCAMTNLGILHTFKGFASCDQELGLKLLRMAATEGDTAAKQALAMYELGTSLGLEGDEDEDDGGDTTIVKEEDLDHKFKLDMDRLTDAMFSDRKKDRNLLQDAQSMQAALLSALEEMNSFPGGADAHSRDHFKRNTLFNAIMDLRQQNLMSDEDFNFCLSEVRTATGRDSVARRFFR